MKNLVKWTAVEGDGVKREVRVTVTRGALKWQFKRANADAWDYAGAPLPVDWERLEDILRRRAGRGRAAGMLDTVRKLRARVGG
jgi:hypothetical protein